MQYLVAEFILHFFVGVGACTLVSVWFGHRDQRRPIFRFGGDDPMSLGKRSNWVGWYIFSLIFEMISSFFIGPSLYRELALSIYQATAMTLGMFLVDRIAMMVEPEKHWLSKKEKALVEIRATEQPAVVTHETPAVAPQETGKDESWIEKKIDSAQEAVQSVSSQVVSETAEKTSDLAQRMRAKFATFKSERELRKNARANALAEAHKKRVADFKRSVQNN
jgi:hypothetical protein